MKYKKPVILVTIGAACLAALTVLVLSVDQTADNTELLASVYRTDLIVYSSDGIGGPTESGPMYAVSADHQLYRKNLDAEPWNHLGTLTPYDLTNRELKDYAAREKGWTTGYRLREITDAWYLSAENDMFYLVFRTKNGDTLLSYGWEDMGERRQGASDDTSLTFLYRLQPTGDADSTIGLTMTSLLNGPLLTMDTLQRDDCYVHAFSCGELYRDWGYAIFKEYDDAFKLLDWHVYENAALAENGIYVCPDPAVLSDDGSITDKNTYDVVLNQNEDLASIIHIIQTDGEVYETNEQMLCGQPLILLSWADQNAPNPHSVSRHFYDTQGERIEVSSMTQEDLMLAVFSQDYPNTAPIDWVLADDGAQELLGVVIFSEKPGATEFAFVKNSHCARAGLGAAVCPESDLIYEGDATVSVVLQDDKADLYRMYLAYSVNEEKRETHFDHWAELIQDSPMQTFTPQTEDEERLLNLFQKSMPNTEPLDWVLADDGAEGLLGVVLFAGENGGTNFAFVQDQVCFVTGLGAKFTEESDLIYEGGGIVSVVLLHTDGVHRTTSMSYSEDQNKTSDAS